MMWPFPMESVHPMVVHFPIALLLTAVMLDAAALVGKRTALHRIALWNFCLGTLMAGLAVWSGLRAAEVAKHTFEIHQIMELHRKLGIATLILGGITTGWRLWKRDRLGTLPRALTVLVALVMTGTLVYGAHLGGRLVYEFGVGGSFGGAQASGSPSHHH
jgi:uncharacterized membrane protein